MKPKDFGRVYLAGRYSRREELCKYRDELMAAGFNVRARWLDGKHQIDDKGKPIGDQGEALVESDLSAEHAALRAKFAEDDFVDAFNADTIISFTEAPRTTGNRGGRHVEFGIGLAMGASLVVIGHRENIFHWLDQVEFFESWETFRPIFSQPK